MKHTSVGAFVSACLLSASAHGADTDLKTSPLGEAFGSRPDMWNLNISPDGSKLSFLRDGGEDRIVLTVLDLASGDIHQPAYSEPDKLVLQSCEWMNTERLFCTMAKLEKNRGMTFPYTRHLAVNYDGEEGENLGEDATAMQQVDFQLVDLLYEDDARVLVQKRDEADMDLFRLDTYTGKFRRVDHGSRYVSHWLADGTGQPRMRRISYDEGLHYAFEYRMAGEEDWHTLVEKRFGDYGEALREEDYFSPVGFGDDPNELLYHHPHEGKRALWARDLTKPDGEGDRLVFSHPDVDVGGIVQLGRDRRTVGVTYTTDRRHVAYFDDRIEDIASRISSAFPDHAVTIESETWDRRYYVVAVENETAPRTYYRFDAEEAKLARIAHAFPQLSERTLSAMQPIEYRADDGETIPAYLTLPESGGENLPTVILPHGGPQARDARGFNPLVQYLAAKGYAVLQSNFRGSGGFGNDWVGNGGFRDWERVVQDLTDGAGHLVDEGIADPERICAVGWSYGGYAALMSAIEEQALYQCVASVAGVTDPETQMDASRYFMYGDVMKELLGKGDKNVTERGSPLRRADELSNPVLLFHGGLDFNVDIRNSERLEDALSDAGKPVTFVEYEDAGHQIEKPDYRIDLFTRLGDFLDANIGG